MVVAFSNSSWLEISWRPPQLGNNLTTAFTLTCTPLLAGIPQPRPLSTASGEELSLSLAGLYPGVAYNCSVVTVTSEGQSEPESIVQTTDEIGGRYLGMTLPNIHSVFHLQVLMPPID